MPAKEPATVTITSAIPILPMFNECKAREFYIDILGFTIEFEHRFEA
ncbi:glyoxalase superfamily protein, partial [Pseudomonas syringae pv. tagetis]